MVPAGLGFGRPARPSSDSDVVVGSNLALPAVRLSPWLTLMPRRFKRSARVSRLVRSSRIGVVDARRPGLERADMLACSLCCQQYRRSSRGLSTRSLPPKGLPPPRLFWLRSEVAMGRRHERPPDVMPRHVVDGFLESERATSDSGVLAMNGICGRTPGNRSGSGLQEEESSTAPCHFATDKRHK